MGENLSKAAASFWASLVAQAWEDDEFKQQLLEDPEKVIRGQGYGELLDANGEKITFKVEEATNATSCAFDAESNTLTFYLPERPDCLKQMEFNGQFTAGACC